MSDNKIVKMQKPLSVKEINDIKEQAAEISDVMASLLKDITVYIGNLEYIKNYKDSIFPKLKPLIGLHVNITEVSIAHAPHIIRHASLGVLPTLDNREYAKLIIPENVGDEYITDDVIDTLSGFIVTLRGIVANVNSFIIASATLRDPSINKKCFEISVAPLKSTEDDENAYKAQSKEELLSMMSAVMPKEDIIEIFERFLF